MRATFYFTGNFTTEASEITLANGTTGDYVMAKLKEAGIGDIHFEEVETEELPE